MKKRIIFLTQMLVILITSFTLYACDKDENKPLDYGETRPNKEVPDPTGTINLSMTSGNRANATLIDDLFYIGNDNNFTGNNDNGAINPAEYKDCFFASIGTVKGLGNVTYIPTTGWAKKVAVTPGNGYVAYCKKYNSFIGTYENLYYRIYVSNYITNETGNILGAYIKYQKPFEGKDEAISLKTESVTFPSEGGTQTLFFENSSIILFDIEAYIPCEHSIRKTISTFDFEQPFLSNGIAITVKENTSTDAINGRIILTTSYGKKTLINVTVSGK